jgi:hypothetical protein
MGICGLMLCTDRTKRNKPCRANAIEGSEKCFFHSEGKEEERLKARVKGGKSNVARFIGVVHLSEDRPDFPLDTAEDARVFSARWRTTFLEGRWRR